MNQTRETVDIRLSRTNDLELFDQARDTLIRSNPVGFSDPTHVDVASRALDVFANGQTPPIRRFLTTARVTELRVEIADDLDTDPSNVSPLAACSDAVSCRRGAMSSIDFVARDATELDGYARAAELVDAPADDPAAVLETVLSRYIKIFDLLPDVDGCDHLSDYRVDGSCLVCFDERATAEDREIAQDLVDGLGGPA